MGPSITLPLRATRDAASMVEYQDHDMGHAVLIVDDRAGRRLARALLLAAGCEVLVEAGDAELRARAARELAPDVVLPDVLLPDISGFEVARRIREERDPPAIILISSPDASDYRERIDRDGALVSISKAHLAAGSLETLLQARDT